MQNIKLVERGHLEDREADISVIRR